MSSPVKAHADQTPYIQHPQIAVRPVPGKVWKVESADPDEYKIPRGISSV